MMSRAILIFSFYRYGLHSIIMVVVASYLVFAPFYEAPLQSFYCVLFVSAGIPFYLGLVRYNVAPPSFRPFVGKSTRILHSNYMTIRLDSTHFFFFFFFQTERLVRWWKREHARRND